MASLFCDILLLNMDSHHKNRNTSIYVFFSDFTLLDRKHISALLWRKNLWIVSSDRLIPRTKF